MTTAAWAQLEPALSALFKRIATVPGSPVVPAVAGALSPSVVEARLLKNKLPAPSRPVTLDWYIVSIVGVGKDEIRSEYRPGTFDATEEETPIEIPGDVYEPNPDEPDERLGGVVVSQHGQRTWTLELRAESHNQSQPATETMRALVDSMRLDSVNAELEAIGLAYTGWSELTDDAYDDEDGRAVSVYIAQLFFNGSSFREDAPQTTIESAEITTEIHTDGED
jgi:hypothetical protein